MACELWHHVTGRRWDATYLYVGAMLQETQVWANQTQENAVIFHDNDFEVRCGV
jgi:hypothetical protein